MLVIKCNEYEEIPVFRRLLWKKDLRRLCEGYRSFLESTEIFKEAKEANIPISTGSSAFKQSSA